jgi:predicted TIM-barrel fold metal-dependent hydrolase
MSVPLDLAGGPPIDCDLHPALPGCMALLPHLDAHWREVITNRGLDDLDLALFPRGAPLTARRDWRPEQGLPGGTLEALRREALDPFGTGIGICNPLFGAPALHNADLAAALCRAANDWMVTNWLEPEPRLRAGILVPVENPELAVEEIERRAGDPRFVQAPPRRSTAAGSTGRSTPRRSGMACPSPCTPAAPRATPPPPSAGRPT